MATTAESLDRERKAIELRRAGYTYDDIATTLGYADHTGARDACIRAIKRATDTGSVDELRQQELDRLDKLQTKAWAMAMNNDLQAVATCLRIIDRRAKLLGLDAPVRQEITVEHLDTSLIDQEVARLVQLLENNNDSVKQ